MEKMLDDILAEDSIGNLEEIDESQLRYLEEGKNESDDEDEDDDEDDDDEDLDESSADGQGDGKVTTKKTDLPKGDNDPKPKLPASSATKTRFGMINAMSNKMVKMDKTSLTAMYGKVMEDVAEADIDTSSAINFNEDLEAVVNGEATLSEGFKEKAAVIMEAAVNARVSQAIESLEENYNEEMQSELTEFTDGLVDKVDEYLNYVVEQFMDENALSINNGLRTEIAEDFMGKLHGLFTESYIEVPDTKVDLVDNLAEENEVLKSKLNDAIELGLRVNEDLQVQQREAIIAEASKNLTDTQVEKLAGLAEGVEFNSKNDFQDKIDTLITSYFSQTKTVTSDIVENAEDANTEVSTTDPLILATLNAMRSTA